MRRVTHPEQPGYTKGGDLIATAQHCLFRLVQVQRFALTAAGIMTSRKQHITASPDDVVESGTVSLLW